MYDLYDITGAIDHPRRKLASYLAARFNLSALYKPTATDLCIAPTEFLQSGDMLGRAIDNGCRDHGIIGPGLPVMDGFYAHPAAFGERLRDHALISYLPPDIPSCVFISGGLPFKALTCPPIAYRMALNDIDIYVKASTVAEFTRVVNAFYQAAARASAERVAPYLPKNKTVDVFCAPFAYGIQIMAPGVLPLQISVMGSNTIERIVSSYDLPACAIYVPGDDLSHPVATFAACMTLITHTIPINVDYLGLFHPFYYVENGHVLTTHHPYHCVPRILKYVQDTGAGVRTLSHSIHTTAGLRDRVRGSSLSGIEDVNPRSRSELENLRARHLDWIGCEGDTGLLPSGVHPFMKKFANVHVYAAAGYTCGRVYAWYERLRRDLIKFFAMRQLTHNGLPLLTQEIYDAFNAAFDASVAARESDPDRFFHSPPTPK